ncbi:IPTL-CTERM sorting domain-containing protein [Ottowia thiooxydans]|uniref:IPTL-CTERM protein sorting domain-containing protein n=1 Tax=Ottowia thiooxydans TaxID=219182 RepID=A0ABV2Q869_9BURK
MVARFRNGFTTSSGHRRHALHVACLAGLLAAPSVVFAVCPANLGASSYSTPIQDGGSTCVYTADPVSVTVSGHSSTGLVNVTGNTTVNGVLTITDTNGDNSRGILVSGSGVANFLKDVTVNKPSGLNNATPIEKAGTGTLTFQGNVFATSNTGAPSNLVNTRDGVRNNAGTSDYLNNLNITSQGGTRSGLYVGAGTVNVGGNLTLDFQSTFYATRSLAALWSQGGTTTVTGTSTITTVAASASMPAVMVQSSQVNLNGLTNITSAGAGSAAVDVRTGGIAQFNASGNSIIASGATGIGIQLRGNGAFSSGTGLTVDAQGTSFNYLGATGTTTLTGVTATTAPMVWNADATSVATFTGTGGHFKGASQLASGGQLTVNLSSNALWEATAASSMTLLDLQSGATLDASLLASLPVTGNLTNAGGVVSLARTDATPTNLLDLAGTYTANGGTLALNTLLNDASTSVSDVLRVSSTALGGAPTIITVVADADSTPAFTTGKGILLVQVTGGAASSAAGAFALPGGYLDAGTTRYELVRDAEDGNWYLRSVAAGQLTVSKQVNVPAGAAAFSGTINFTVACTNPTANFSGNIPVSGNSGAAPAILVASGSTCTVSEQLPTAPAGYSWAEPVYTQAGVIPADAAATASIVNTLVKSGGSGGNTDTIQPVPTLGQWGMIFLSTLMALFGFGMSTRRRVG